MAIAEIQFSIRCIPKQEKLLPKLWMACHPRQKLLRLPAMAPNQHQCPNAAIRPEQIERIQNNSVPLPRLDCANHQEDMPVRRKNFVQQRPNGLARLYQVEFGPKMEVADRCMVPPPSIVASLVVACLV